MHRTRLSHLAASLAAAITLSVASAALAADPGTNAPMQQSAMADHASQPFVDNVPGATRQWCDSLAYPYCEDPAPGTPDSAPAPYVHEMTPRPIFGN